MKKLFGLLAVVAAFTATPSLAQTCQFSLAGTITNPPSPAYSSPILAIFAAYCSPTPSLVRVSRFDLNNVTGLFNGPGVAGNNGMGVGPITLADLQFYVAASGGGIGVNYPQSSPNNAGFGLFSLDGAQLFGGTTAAPTFLPGTYTFTEDFFYGPALATLTITRINTPAVPEPATWAMMVLGFGGVGAALRRRLKPAHAFARG